MFIIPILECKLRAPNIRQVWMLLERNGSHLIPIPKDVVGTTSVNAYVEAFLTENEMVSNGPHTQKGAYVFVPIDPERTELDQFWNWKEIAPGTLPVREAWRTFFWVIDEAAATPDSWGVNQFLQDILLAEPPHTAHEVLHHYFGTLPTAPL